jgi:hypothetical protein
MGEMSKYITVLDFEMGRVFQYKLKDFGDNYMFVDKDTPTNEELEYILTDIGHNLSNIEWMSHNIAEIIKSKSWNSPL